MDCIATFPNGRDNGKHWNGVDRMIYISGILMQAESFGMSCCCPAACHMGGRNAVIADRTLDREAMEKYLAGGFTLEAIEYQVSRMHNCLPVMTPYTPTEASK